VVSEEVRETPIDVEWWCGGEKKRWVPAAAAAAAYERDVGRRVVVKTKMIIKFGILLLEFYSTHIIYIYI
jgi:hypothetical protein